MTRTTGISPPSRCSMNAVGMPAATEMTSLSGVAGGAISASSAAMSCGLTVITRVCARRAASAALSTSMP